MLEDCYGGVPFIDFTWGSAAAVAAAAEGTAAAAAVSSAKTHNARICKAYGLQYLWYLC